MISRTSLWIAIGLTAASLVAAIASILLETDLRRDPDVGNDAYSTSAIGHRALLELLRALDRPVERSRRDSAGKTMVATPRGLLVLIEPNVSDEGARQHLAELVKRAHRALVVLPKWYGRAAAGSPWIDEANLVPEADAKAVLAALSIDAEVRRSTVPLVLEAESVQIRAPQTLASSALEPHASSSDGILVGGHGDVWVVSDPDVLNNHGLAQPAHAAFVIELLDRLRDGGPIIIDETVHGYRELGLARTLLQFPLVLVTLQMLVCAALVIWAAMVRFGPQRAAPPPLSPGKDFLISNTAALLQYGGHHADALRRYLAHSVATVRQALHAPSLPPDAVTDWLEAVRRARGLAISLADLERDARTIDKPQRALELADRVYRWRMEMMHGASRRS